MLFIRLFLMVLALAALPGVACAQIAPSDDDAAVQEEGEAPVPPLAGAQPDIDFAEAMPRDEAPQAHKTVVVTSMTKCYALIGAADAADIQKNYARPWEECRRRLARKILHDQTVKAGEGKKGTLKSAHEEEAAPAAIAPESFGGGYYRVQKTPLRHTAAPKKPDDGKKAEEEKATNDKDKDGGKSKAPEETPAEFQARRPSYLNN